jgi:hypothetical protein
MLSGREGRSAAGRRVTCRPRLLYASCGSLGHVTALALKEKRTKTLPASVCFLTGAKR